MIDDATVLEAIRPVRDPELDESIVALDFVTSVVVVDDHVTVRLRLPTYFCAPNFSYLMVADVREAVLGLPDVASAQVLLEDHFTSDEINDGVNHELGFEASFPDFADGELHDLRLLFRRKALMARQYRLTRRLRDTGLTPVEMASLSLRQVPRGDQLGVYLDEYLDARVELGIAVDPDAPLLVDGAGRTVAADAAEEHLARARGVAFSVDLNAEFCSGVLATRYPDARPSRREETV